MTLGPAVGYGQAVIVPAGGSPAPGASRNGGNHSGIPPATLQLFFDVLA